MLFQTLDRLKRSTMMTTILLAVIGTALLRILSDYITFPGSSLALVPAVVCVSGILRFISTARRPHP